MTTSSLLASVYDQLTDFANLSNFWSLFNTAFGSSYDSAKAATFQYQWQNHNFSQFPQIEVVSNEVLGTANGAYGISTNKIYLSDAFISSASQQSLEAVILEEFGHFVDAQINATDTPGDEGELFSDLVRGVNLSAAELSRIKTEDDQAVVMIGGEQVAIEKANGQVNLITNGSFEIGSDPGSSYLSFDPGSTAITGWIVTRDQIDYLGGWVDADGDRSLDLNGSPGVGGIAQTFNTIVGQQYLVSFDLAGNPAGGTPIKQLGVSAAGQSEVFSFDTTGFSGNNMGWVNKTWVFTATASTTTLEFYSLSIEPENFTYGPALDNVCVISLLPSITLAVAPASVTEDGTPNLIYTFTRTGATTSALTVNYGITGTATNSTDYATIGTSVTFAANSATATVTVNPTADTTIENNETVALTLATGTGYTIGTTTAVIGTITNDDFPSITLAVAPVSVLEDGTPNLIYTFTRTGPTTNALTVNYGITGTATSGTDYATIGTNVTFAANSATAIVTVNPTADTTIEANETVALTLATGIGYTIGTTTAVTGTITNDDVATVPNITLAVAPVSVLENGTPNLLYTFTRTGATTSALTVTYSIGGTATNGTDYTTIGSSVTFAAGSTTATVTVDPTADTIIEDNETVALTLATGTGYTIGTTTAVTGTITNDDFPSISINDITVIEGKDLTAPLTLSLSSPSPQTIIVNYTITAVDATANLDYTTSTGTLTFAANSTSTTLSIPILNDNLNEEDESFFVTLSNPINSTLNPDANIGEVIITDTLQSSLTRTLPTNVENLKLIGTAAINGTGNAGNNVLTGNTGNNILTGLAGNDTYSFLANTLLGTDTITETTTGGIDTLNFSGTNNQVRLNLGSITNQTVVTGNLILKLSAVDVIENVIGGNSGDRLTGNSLNNSLDGSGGNDNLSGGNGADTLTGGAGDDILTGGAGNDSFAYVTGKAFTTGDIGLDNLTDFTPTADKLLLSKTTFAALTSIVGNGFSQATDFAVVEDDFLVETSNAFIVYSSNSGSLFYNQNGNAAGLGTGAEFAVLISNPILTSNDFTLIA